MRLLRPTFTAGLALAAALALPGAAHAAELTPAQAADYGAGYLGRQMDATGYLDGFSGPDYGTTAQAVLALVAAGVGESQAAEATEFLLGNVDAFVVDGGGDDKPAALALLILVAHARGVDASALVTRLLATKRTTGPDAGLFGEQDATYDGAYRQGLALLALDAVGQTDADAIAWLTAEQCADGGWMGNNPDPAAACPAFDFTAFVGEETNGTALAAMALAAHGVTPDHDPRDFFAEAQNADGGFGFTTTSASDANSTALVVQALLALGDDLAGWAKANGTPYSFLLSLQLPNPPAKTAGAFAFQPGGGANVFATVQVVQALAGKSLPIAPATLTDTLPLLPAQVPTATPTSAAPTTAPTAAPTVAPTTVPTTVPAPAPTRVANPRPVPELPATGLGEQPWDTTGQVVFALGLMGYGLLALGGARLAARRRG